ncbi:K+ transport system, NAD-binding component [Frankia sp. AiPs1]|uniref:NAD-binding protein n=1 Tax=Frankia sp. AiPa1 TaxID=573492 RepID=UPI00202B7551|nr:NAD-binding protein [Frankia sp. AiPa1]MCL9759439.1 NAD-binding protein [Frankia sp. AiPa1]
MTSGRQGHRPHPAAAALALTGRLARWLRHHLLAVFAVLGVVAFALGLVGTYRHFHANPETFTWSNVVFFAATLFIADGTVFQDQGQYPLPLEIARFLAPIATTVGVADAVSTVFAQRFERFRARRARYHVIVCGSGPTATALVDRLVRSRRVVLVAEDAQREYPDAELPPGLLRVIGDPVEPLVLAQAGVARADVVYGCLPETSSNLAIALAARRLAATRWDQPLRCLAQVGDLSLIPHLRARRIGLSDDAGFRLDFFAVEVLGAHAMLARHPPSWAAADSTIGPPPSPAPAPLVVLGLSGLGRALVLELARRWSSYAGPNGPLLTIAVSDPAATTQLAALRSREPALARIQLTAHDTPGGELTQAVLTAAGSGRPDGPPRPDNPDGPDGSGRPPEFVYVCQDDEEQALLCGLDAAQLVNDRFGVGQSAIVVCTDRQRSLQEVFGQPTSSRQTPSTPRPLLEDLQGGVRFFAVNDEALPIDLGDTDLIERFAQATHTRFLVSEQLRGAQLGSRRSMVPWDELPDDLRGSNRDQVAGFGEILRAQNLMLLPVGAADTDFAFTDAEIERLAPLEHERWLLERANQGFRLGPIRQESGSERRHPAMVDWRVLPDADRERDREVIRTMPSILAHAGLRIVRLDDPA